MGDEFSNLIVTLQHQDNTAGWTSLQVVNVMVHAVGWTKYSYGM